MSKFKLLILKKGQGLKDIHNSPVTHDYEKVPKQDEQVNSLRI